MTISDKARPKAPPPSKGNQIRLVSDEDVSKALDFLRDYAPKIGQARGEVIRLEHRLKTVESFERLKSEAKTEAAKQADARTSKQYKETAEALAVATAEFETLKGLRDAAAMKIEVWRTMAANLRGLL